MRTFNRPMFKYGGPIKEGVMSGIREPHRNGQRVGLYNVGSPGQFPKTGGREHHVGPAIAAVPWFLQAARFAVRPLVRYGANVLKRAPAVGKGGQKLLTAPGKSANYTPLQQVWDPNKATATKFGKYLMGSPEGRLITGGAGWAGAVGKKGLAAAKYIGKSPLTMGGLAWTGYQWLKPDGTAANENEIAKAKESTGGPPGGGDPGMQGTGEWFAEQAEKEALAKEQKDWNNRIKKYRDIMDIKGMNKQAAYKSLIDASKLIQESEDFKGDIRSGKLINQVIQSASKQFEKPAKTRDAIDTLILKGEIEKDIKASDPSNAMLNELRGLQGKKLLKELNPSKSDLVAVYAKAGVKGQSLYDNAAKELAANKGEVFRGNLIPKSDFTEILAELKKNPETKNADDVTIIATWTQNELNNSQKNIPDGNYTVGSTIVTIKDKQVIDVK